MSLIGVPLAVLTMVLAQRVERRVGAAAAGWVAGLPIALAVAGATIAITGAPADAAQMVFSAAGHTGPMIGYAVTYVALAPRVGAVRAFALSTLVYVAASALLLPLPGPARIVTGLCCVAAALAALARRPLRAPRAQRASRSQQFLVLASAGAVVALISLVNQLAGPELAGAVGAFPVMTTTMALFVAHRSGARHSAHVMRGLLRSLPIYLTYCLVFGFAITRLGILWALIAATLIALGVAALTWQRGQQTQTRDTSPLYAEP